MLEIMKNNLKECLGFELQDDDVKLEGAVEGK
jgi:hypothetical protein